MPNVVSRGTDVSYAQGTINWPVVAKNVDFAMIRATLGYPSPGFTGVDRCWEANISGAVNSGIPFGLYHYSYALTTDAAKKEAENFLDKIKGYKPTYPVAFDFEEPKQLALPAETQMDIIDTFMETVEQAGYYAVLYMSASPMLALMRAQKERMGFYDKWVAHVGVASPAVSGGIWQYSWKGEVPGIRDDLPSGHAQKGVDLDYAYKDYPNLIKSNGKNGWGKRVPTEPVIETVPKAEYDALETKYNALINGMKALIGG
ncbi:glycoside hydrolase family 25 protein [Marasmitruncus massiliensis]|uniref:glycoside hydrolase family 25 protein n=1 Tax=Marasmitruncus massiliensis TaxID=1944642 RepID=UPI000C7CCAF6|nr:glycoside hydrolase family 25 protein [Marasmitruncus massiliensis]